MCLTGKQGSSPGEAVPGLQREVHFPSPGPGEERGAGRGREGPEVRIDGCCSEGMCVHALRCADPPSSAQEFAVNLWNRVSAIHEVPPPKSFTFLSDACRGLEQARKVGGARNVPRGLVAGQLSSDRIGWREGGGSRCEAGASLQPGGLTWAPLGAGLCLRVQLLQPGNGANGRGGAADREPGAAHQCPADPPG